MNPNSSNEIIFTVHKELIEILTKQNQFDRKINQFDKHKNVSQKIDYVQELLIKNDLIPTFTNREPKNDNKSLSLRKSGNELFEADNFLDALLMYNESICFANNSEYLSISYANRSAVYFELKMYDQCLENIHLAKMAGYPQRYLAKINKREANCRKALKMNNKKQIVDDQQKLPFKLAFSSHPIVQSASNCLEIKHTNAKGRHIVTNRALKPGQVVSIESTIYHDLQQIFSYERCANCLKDNSFNLIPCKLCTNTMYCGEICMNEAENGYHQYVCLINDYFNGILFHEHISAIRIAIKVLCSFASDVKELISFMQKITTTIDTESNAFINEKNSIHYDDIKYYQLYSVLGANEKNIQIEKRFQQAVISAVAYQQLMTNTSLKDVLLTDESKAMFKELIYRFLLAIPTHSQSLDAILSHENQNNGAVTYAKGIYAVAGLINHSCENNILMENNGSKLIICVMRPIKKGGELFWHNRIHHINMGKTDRNTKLQNRFNFTCNCRACANDYPSIYNASELKLRDLQATTKYVINRYDQHIEKQTAEIYLKKLFNSFRDYEEVYPCRELLFGIASASILLKIICDEGSFRAKIKAKIPKKTSIENFTDAMAEAIAEAMFFHLMRAFIQTHSHFF